LTSVHPRGRNLAAVRELPTSSPKIWEQRKEEGRSGKLAGRDGIPVVSNSMGSNGSTGEDQEEPTLAGAKDSVLLRNEQFMRDRKHDGEEGDPMSSLGSSMVRPTSGGTEATSFQPLSDDKIKTSRKLTTDARATEWDGRRPDKDNLGDSVGAHGPGLQTPLLPQGRMRAGVRLSRDGFDKYESMDVDDLLRMTPPPVVAGFSTSPDFADHERSTSIETEKGIVAPKTARPASGNKSRPKSRVLKSPPLPALDNLDTPAITPRKQRYSLGSPLIPVIPNNTPPVPSFSQQDRQSMRSTSEREKPLKPSLLESSQLSTSPPPITSPVSNSLPVLLRQRRKSLVERDMQIEPLPPMPISAKPSERLTRLSMPPPSSRSKSPKKESGKDVFAAIGAAAMGVSRTEVSGGGLGTDARKSLPASFFHGTNLTSGHRQNWARIIQRT